MICCMECINHTKEGSKHKCRHNKNKTVIGELQEPLQICCGHFIKADKTLAALYELPEGARVYISGRISGNKYYKSEFGEAEKRILNAGYKAENPAKLDLGESATWCDYMKQDLKTLCDCDAIYMLSAWQRSKGATLEHRVAESLGLTVIYE